MHEKKGGGDGGRCCVETAEGRTLTFHRTSPRKHRFLSVCVSWCVCVCVCSGQTNLKLMTAVKQDEGQIDF